jgi:tetratricopeptide (TPR) repeat protein
MDNASRADQVAPLITPTSCLLLVTSRVLFHLPGLRVKDLDELPPEEARALLLRVAPRIGDQADRLAEICTGVPFALRQAAGTLSERPDLSPASYVSRLESRKARLNLIEASLSLSYDLLPEDLACHWRTLSVFPATFDEMHEQHLAIARQIADRRGEGNALGNLGLAYDALGKTSRAMEIYEQVVAIARDIGNRRAECLACWYLGLALEKLGELGRAVALMQIYVDYQREIGHPEAEEHAAQVEALRALIAGAAATFSPDQLRAEVEEPDELRP